MKKYIGEIGLFVVAIIWGGGLIAAKVALDSGFTTSQIMTIRFFISAVLMAIIFFKPIKNNMSIGILKAGSILGVCLFLGFFLQTLGLEYTTPSKNAFLASINVVIVPFIGWVLYKRKIDKFGVASSFIAILGIAVLSLNANFTINFGDFLTISCAFAFAFQIFFTSEFVKSYNPLALNVIQFTVAFLLSLIAQIAIGETTINTTPSGYIAIIYLAVFSTTICYLLQTMCSKIVDGTRVAIIMSTESVFGTIFSIILLNEPMTFRIVLGSLIIFISVITAETKLSFLPFFKNKKKA